MLPAQVPQPSVSVKGRPARPAAAVGRGVAHVADDPADFGPQRQLRAALVELGVDRNRVPLARELEDLLHRSSISSKSLHFQTVRTGESFSPENRSSRPIFSPMHHEELGSPGTLRPARSAMNFAIVGHDVAVERMAVRPHALAQGLALLGAAQVAALFLEARDHLVEDASPRGRRRSPRSRRRRCWRSWRP